MNMRDWEYSNTWTVMLKSDTSRMGVRLHCGYNVRDIQLYMVASIFQSGGWGNLIKGI